MPNYIRMRVPGGVYFFGVNLLDRRKKWLIEQVDDLRKIFAEVKDKHPFHIDAVVILPEHFHCLITLPPGDENYSLRLKLIKERFSRKQPRTENISRSRQRHGERGIWQRRFWEHTIKDQDDYARHVDYIHYNPVKHGYVQNAADWKYSSIHRFIEQGVLASNWGASRQVQELDFEIDADKGE